MGKFEAFVLVYVITNTVLNSCWIFLPFFKLNYYKGKWGKKKEPLYKLEWNSDCQRYSIYQYNINYESKEWKNEVLTLLSIFVIPFFTVFKFPHYIKGNCYGKFSMEDISIMKDFDLGEFWNKQNQEAWNIYFKQVDESCKKNKILNNVNKDFNEHYN